VIPPDFDRGFYSRQPAQVQLLVDGSNPIIAGQVINIVSAASTAVGRRLAWPLGNPGLPFEVRTRIWYNARLSSLVSMVPGLMAIVLTLPALALALSLTRERELGTLEALMATPIPKGAYLFGKTAAYVLTGLAGFLGSWLVAVAWFQVPMRGNLGLLVLLTVAYFVATMGFSLFVSSWVSSQQTAMFLVIAAFYVPSFFLTGLIDPIDWSSWRAVVLALPLPATHYMAIARGILLKGVGLETLAQPAVMLLGMGLGGLLIATAIFRKKLA
jgi:ABC-2 type transport system permease protein